MHRRAGRCAPRGGYEATLLTAASPDVYNDVDAPDQVAPKVVELAFEAGVVMLPPHSLVVVKVGLSVGAR